MSIPPPTVQTNPLSPVPNAVEIAGGFKINQTWSQWLYDLREKVNVIGITIAQMGGSTTPQEAFNNISPLTTKGDLLGFSTINDRFPVGGTDGWVLTIDHTQPFGVKWAVGGGGGDPIHVTTVTSDYTVAITDLPNASSNNGLIVANFSSSANIKIDKKANTSIPVGAHLFIVEQGIGKVTILGLPGVSLHGPSIADGGQYSRGEAIQIAEDSWNIFGNIEFTSIAPTTFDPDKTYSSITLSNGNLTATQTVGGTSRSSLGTSSQNASDTSGFYFEVHFDHGYGGGNDYEYIGVVISSYTTYSSSFVGDPNGYGYYSQTGNKENNGTLTSYGNPWVAGDVIGVFLKNGEIWFSKNGVWQNSGDPVAGTNPAFSGLSGSFLPAISLWRSADAMTARFASTDFTYPIPTGGSAWGV